MDESLDLYAVLGIPAVATPEEIRQAYRQAVRRFHPDANPDPAAAEEIRRINEAYETLNDPDRRADYDYDARHATPQAFAPGAVLKLTTAVSRSRLPAIREPQVVYVLARISAAPAAAQTAPAPPLNLCLVLDRSNSMQGPRMDQVKAASMLLVDRLTDADTFAVVTFADRAEVILPPQREFDRHMAKAKISTIRAEGGTEILQGLVYGLAELHRFLSPEVASHLILLTDGHTYGDEADCLLLANMAEADRITIHGLGIGDEWNDAFLDDLAGRTGGSAAYVDSPEVVGKYFQEQLLGMGSAFAEKLQLEVLPDPGIELRSAFRLTPEPAPLTRGAPLRLGNLRRTGEVVVLLEFLAPPREPGRYNLSRLIARGDVPGLKRFGERASTDVNVEVVDEAPTSEPPDEMIEAVRKVNLYQMQERAAAEAAEGKLAEAIERLERLAQRLMANGAAALAQAALAEAASLRRSRAMSPSGQKQLKYGTRALLAAPLSFEPGPDRR